MTITYREELERTKATIYSPILRCIAGARVLLFPKTIARFYSMNLMRKLRHPTDGHDPLYFLVHNFYISRQFSLRQRADVDRSHRGVLGELELPNAKGLKPVRAPDALYRRDADAGGFRHGRAGPMRGLARRRFHHQGDNAFGDRGVEFRDAHGRVLSRRRPSKPSDANAPAIAR